jgi:hypothetical protein
MRGPRTLAQAGHAPGMRVRAPPLPVRPLATPRAAAEWHIKVPKHGWTPKALA